MSICHWHETEENKARIVNSLMTDYLFEEDSFQFLAWTKKRTTICKVDGGKLLLYPTKLAKEREPLNIRKYMRKGE